MNDASLGLAGIQASSRWARPHVRSRNGWVSLPQADLLPRCAGRRRQRQRQRHGAMAAGPPGHRPDVLPAPLLAATLHALISTPGERRAGWRRERISEADYAIGWRVFDYAGHRVVFHAGAVQGYRGMIAMIPEEDFGTVILWNSESPLPSGLLPTILDRARPACPQRGWTSTRTSATTRCTWSAASLRVAQRADRQRRIADALESLAALT
jgi:beta-lactamase class C